MAPFFLPSSPGKRADRFDTSPPRADSVARPPRPRPPGPMTEVPAGASAAMPPGESGQVPVLAVIDRRRNGVVEWDRDAGRRGPARNLKA